MTKKSTSFEVPGPGFSSRYENESRQSSDAGLPVFYSSETPIELRDASLSPDCGASYGKVDDMPSPVTTKHMNGPVAYIGGKNRLAKRLIALFPQHVTYCEVFLGGGQVFFRKEPSKVEVLNDLDGEVVNFFRCVQQQSFMKSFCRYLKFTLVGRQWFEIFDKQNPATLTDIQRAARFFYLQKNAYAGLVHGRHYACKVVSAPGFDATRLPKILENAHSRLARAQIESLPFHEFIPRYDRPGTLFFLRPAVLAA